MRKIILIFTFLSLALSSPVNANEIACKAYDIPCKMKKFGDETKEYQKKEWDKAGKKLKKVTGSNK